MTAARLLLILLAGQMLATGPAFGPVARADDRHVGYYYPEPEEIETYNARAVTLKDASRDRRLAFITGLTRQLLNNPYPPQFAIFAKGDDAQKLIITGLYDGGLNSRYRMRALFAMLTATARLTKFFNEYGVAEYFTFFDLCKLLGFEQITFTDGHDFAHQVLLR